LAANFDKSDTAVSKLKDEWRQRGLSENNPATRFTRDTFEPLSPSRVFDSVEPLESFDFAMLDSDIRHDTPAHTENAQAIIDVLGLKTDRQKSPITQVLRAYWDNKIPQSTAAKYSLSNNLGKSEPEAAHAIEEWKADRGLSGASRNKKTAGKDRKQTKKSSPDPSSLEKMQNTILNALDHPMNTGPFYPMDYMKDLGFERSFVQSDNPTNFFGLSGSTNPIGYTQGASLGSSSTNPFVVPPLPDSLPLGGGQEDWLSALNSQNPPDWDVPNHLPMGNFDDVLGTLPNLPEAASQASGSIKLGESAQTPSIQELKTLSPKPSTVSSVKRKRGDTESAGSISLSTSKSVLNDLHLLSENLRKTEADALDIKLVDDLRDKLEREASVESDDITGVQELIDEQLQSSEKERHKRPLQKMRNALASLKPDFARQGKRIREQETTSTQSGQIYPALPTETLLANSTPISNLSQRQLPLEEPLLKQASASGRSVAARQTLVDRSSLEEERDKIAQQMTQLNTRLDDVFRRLRQKGWVKGEILSEQSPLLPMLTQKNNILEERHALKQRLNKIEMAIQAGKELRFNLALGEFSRNDGTLGEKTGLPERDRLDAEHRKWLAIAHEGDKEVGLAQKALKQSGYDPKAYYPTQVFVQKYKPLVDAKKNAFRKKDDAYSRLHLVTDRIAQLDSPKSAQQEERKLPLSDATDSEALGFPPKPRHNVDKYQRDLALAIRIVGREGRDSSKHNEWKQFLWNRYGEVNSQADRSTNSLIVSERKREAGQPASTSSENSEGKQSANSLLAIEREKGKRLGYPNTPPLLPADKLDKFRERRRKAIRDVEKDSSRQSDWQNFFREAYDKYQKS